MKWMLIVAALLIGIAIGITYQKSKPVPHTPIFVRVGNLSQKALLNPQPGDVIQWLDPGGSSVTPSWIFNSSPCDPTDPNNECRILASANHKKYAYKCPMNMPCDPEVPVGSDVLLHGQGTMTASKKSPGEQIYIGCPSGSVDTDPEVAPVSKSLQGFAYWQPLDPVSQWSVSNWRDDKGNPAKVCQEDTIQDGKIVCTLDGGVAEGTYTYTATAKDNCATKPSGDYKLQVTK